MKYGTLYAAAAGLFAPLAAIAATPPLSQGVLDTLAKQDASTYKFFALHNTTESNIAGRQILERRAAPNNLNGLIETCTADSCLVYTFDDGPFDYHKLVVDMAVKSNIKVTFFVNVNNYDCIYNEARVDALRYAYERGMHFCSHTATHPHLNALSEAQIDRQVQATEDALYKILGVVPSCIRPPYGEADERVVNYLNNRWGYVVINWNQDSGDSMGKSAEHSLNVLRKIRAPSKAIVLMHETVPTTPQQVFPQAFQIAQQNGYDASNIRTIPDSLGFNGYKVVGQRSERDGSWNCNGLTPGDG